MSSSPLFAPFKGSWFNSDSIMVLTFHVKFQSILIVMILVYHSSALSNFCADHIEDTNPDDNNINISCIILSNTLNASWITENHVENLRIDYTCTTSGMGQMIGTVFAWGSLSEGSTLIEDIFPTASSPLSFEPTCFIDGCYDWTSPRAGFPTWSIPTVACTEIVETTISPDPPAVTITPQFQNPAEPLSSSFSLTVLLPSRFDILANSLSSSFEFSMAMPTKDPSNDQTGLLPYMWILVSVVIITGLLMIQTCVMIILTAKRRMKREITENQPNSSCPGTHTKLHKRRQLPPIGLFRILGVSSEHSKGKDITSQNMSESTEQEPNCCLDTLSFEQQGKRSKLPPSRRDQNSKHPEGSKETRNDNALEITEQEQICCPGTPSVEQQVKRSRLSPLKLFSRSNKQPQEQLGRSEEKQKFANTYIEIIEHEEPIQGNLIGMRQDSLLSGVCIKICDEHWGDTSTNVSVQENTVKLQRSTSEDRASISSAQHGINDTLEDTDRRQHRGARSPSHHQNSIVCQDSKVDCDSTEPATSKDWSINEDV